MTYRKYITAFLSFMVLTILCSCCKDEYLNETDLVQDSCCKIKTNMYAVRDPFDPSPSDTRSGGVTTVWKDSAIIYLLFNRANGSTTTGQAVYSEDADAWTVTYNQSLARNEQTKCVAYYFDGNVSSDKSTIKLNATTGVYVDSAASYIFPTNGILNISCKLRPITSRVRFVGDVGKNQLLVDGLRHYTVFSLDDFSLQSDASQIGINEYNGTDYIYGLWETDEKQELSLSHNFCRFTNDFTGMHILQKGKSGKIDLPTEDNHNGWVMRSIPHDVIDLGLSVYWRVENLGVEVKRNSSNDYPYPPLSTGWYCKWGDSNATSKTNYYECDLACIAGNPVYDAATKLYGYGWSTPTSDQWEELLSKCKLTFDFVTSGIYQIGYDWCEVQGPNGNKIIISFCGEKNTPSRDRGQYAFEFWEGYYWTADKSKNGHPKCVHFRDAYSYQGVSYPEEADVIEKRDVKFLSIRPVYRKE